VLLGLNEPVQEATAHADSSPINKMKVQNDALWEWGQPQALQFPPTIILTIKKALCLQKAFLIY
jgi:hypothetical protein